MEKRIKKIVVEALRVFEKTTGLKANLQTESPNNTKHPDGLIQIAHQNRRWHFAVVVKARMTRATAGMGKLDPLNRKEKVLIITEYVTPPIADLLKKLNIFFTDTAGNVYIPSMFLLRETSPN
jgi:hypothetical protein